jgi:NAD(P)-dependent dehydrogenase (short-subunit alcohol dehydrogenase family)
MTRRPNHALIVGGTGMLREVALQLARGGSRISVIGRDRSKLATLEGQSSGLVRGISLDYRDSKPLLGELEAAMQRDGPIDLAVCWIHSDALDAPIIVAQAIASTTHPPRYLHVLGSASADPSRADERHKQLETLPGIVRRTVILGFVIDAEAGSRWLTNEEISRGVIDAIESDRPETVVGVVRPWSRRP